MRGTFLVFGSPMIGEEEIAEVCDTLRSGWIGTGPKTRRFEEEFASYAGARHALALNSATAGLHLALDSYGITEGDEVVTTPMTFVSTANVICHCGGMPVFADIDRETMNINPAKMEAAITPRTKALMVVHMAGRPCEMDEISAVAARHGLPVIEDAAHAVESVYRGRKIGSISDLTVFSFYATKNLSTGEGGMVTGNDAERMQTMRSRSLHGLSRDAWKRYSASGFEPYEALYPGFKYNMTDIQASLGLHQLHRLAANLRRREEIWLRYNDAFQGREELVTPVESSGITHGRHLYTLLVEPSTLTVTRDQFIQELKARNIGAGVHFVAVHLQRYYRETFGFQRGDFPDAEWISDRTLSLPLSAKLTDRDVQDVIDAVIDIVEVKRRRMWEVAGS